MVIGMSTYDGLIEFYNQMRETYDHVWGEHVHYAHISCSDSVPSQEVMRKGINQYTHDLVHFGLSAIPACFRETNELRILDLCCGTGPIFDELVAQKVGGEYVGVDIVPMHIDIFKQRIAQNENQRNVLLDHRTVVQDIETYLDNEIAAQRLYDLVVCQDSFYHVKTKERVIRKVFEILQPGGVFVVSDLAVDQTYSTTEEFLSLLTLRQAGSYPLTFETSKNSKVKYQFEEICHKVGFRTLQEDHTSDLVTSYKTAAILVDTERSFFEVTGKNPAILKDTFSKLARAGVDRHFQLKWWIVLKPSQEACIGLPNANILAKLKIEDAGFRYKDSEHNDNLLNSMAFDIRQGEYLLLLGRNGTGKTTVLRALAGILPRSNMISVECNCRVALVQQRPILFDDISVRSGISLVAASVKGRTRTAIRKEVDKLIDACGLEHVKKKRMQLLSGGEKQRASIALAIASKPGLLLLDEPLASQDIIWRERLQRLFRELQQGDDTLTILQVTHRLDEVDTNLINRVMEIWFGDMIQVS